MPHPYSERPMFKGWIQVREYYQDDDCQGRTWVLHVGDIAHWIGLNHDPRTPPVTPWYSKEDKTERTSKQRHDRHPGPITTKGLVS